MFTLFKKYIFILILLGLLVVPAASYAAQWQLMPNCANNPGGCNVCHAIEVGINITKIMLGLLGSAALLMFIYGGFIMFTSRGHSDQVQKGKDALINAVKGVIIVLASWMVINYGLAIILDKSINDVKLFGNKTNWATVACDNNAPKKCDELPDYSCQDITTLPPEKVTSCQKNLCPGVASNQCCPN